MTTPPTNGFRLGVYVFKDVEIIDFAAPYGVFSVARRFDPELDAFLRSGSFRFVARTPSSSPIQPYTQEPVHTLVSSVASGSDRTNWVVDSGRIVTAGGIASGMELGFHLLRRAGYSEDLVAEVARVMEYSGAYELYRQDVERSAHEADYVGAMA